MQGWRRNAIGVCALAVACAWPAASGPSAQASLIAPGSACRGQQNTHAPEHLQQRAMRCLINRARRAARAGPVASNHALERAAGRKAHDVIRCGFSHTACGNAADRWARSYGYMSGTSAWQWGENLAWGRGGRGTARRVLKAWLASPPHRATLLRSSFEHLGIGLRRGRFAGGANAAVWTLELGCRGC